MASDSIPNAKFQTAKRLRSRSGYPARASTFSISRSVSTPSKREQSAVRRKESVPLQGARDRSCRTGLALRRSTAASSILGAPLPSWPAHRRSRRLRDIDPGPRNGPGGCPPRTPGTAVCETAGAGAAPPPRSVRSAERPSVDGDESDICPIMKFSQEDKIVAKQKTPAFAAGVFDLKAPALPLLLRLRVTEPAAALPAKFCCCGAGASLC